MSVCRCLSVDELGHVEADEHLQWMVKDKHGLLMRCNQTGIFFLRSIFSTEWQGGYYTSLPRKISEEEAVKRFGRLAYGGYEPTLPKLTMALPGAQEVLEEIRAHYRPKTTGGRPVNRGARTTAAPPQAAISPSSSSRVAAKRAGLQRIRRAFWYFAAFLAGTMSCLQVARLAELLFFTSTASLQRTIIGLSSALIFGLATRSFLRRARANGDVSEPPRSNASPPG